MSVFGDKENPTAGALVGRWWLSIACCALLLGCGGTSSSVDGPGGGSASDGDGDGASISDSPDDDDDGGGDNATDGTGTNGNGGGSMSADDDDDDSPPRAPEVVIETTLSREKMSELLVAPAEKAMEDRDYGLAITLYNALVTARGYGGDDAINLAKAWTLRGEADNAVKVYEEYIARGDDPDKLKAAKKERDRLAKGGSRFSSEYRFVPATALAKKVFALGRTAYNDKKWGDAIVYYEMGFALDPDLAGFLRELGAAYDALDIVDKKIAFYQAYLRRRPIGGNADDVRKALAEHENVLGKLVMSTPLPCEEAWINGQLYGKLAKDKKVEFVVAPGDYLGLCFQPEYGLALWQPIEVEAGTEVALAFNWAVVVNELKDPWGRIVVENALSPGVMQDLGISQKQFGIPVYADGRALKFILKADDGSKKEERNTRIEPGETLVIKW